MVRGSIQTRARTSNVVGAGCLVLMCCITVGWDLVATLAIACVATIGAIVWELIAVRGSTWMVWVEWTCQTTWLLTSEVSSLSSKQGRINSFDVHNPWEGCGRSGKK